MSNENNFNGKILIRIPKYLHKMLSDRASDEGVSVNQLVQTYISIGLGSTQVAETMAEYVVNADLRKKKSKSLSEKLKLIEENDVWYSSEETTEKMKSILEEVMNDEV